MTQFNFKFLVLFTFLLQPIQSQALSLNVNKAYGNILRPFTSDGCSKFPDGPILANNTKWRHCCVAHDIDYWHGGTAFERFLSDSRLKTCVAKTGAEIIANLMFLGIRVGGYANFSTSWHWGYGWKLYRGYKPLNSHERSQTNKLAEVIPRDLSKVKILSPDIIPQRESVSGNHCLDRAIEKIYEQLKSPFHINHLEEIETGSLGGNHIAFQIKTQEHDKLYRFELRLKGKDTCIEDLNEWEARNRIRLLKFSEI